MHEIFIQQEFNLINLKPITISPKYTPYNVKLYGAYKDKYLGHKYQIPQHGSKKINTKP